MSHSVFVIEGLEVKIILTDFLLCRGGGAVAVLRMDDLASLLRMSGCLVVDNRLKFFQTVVFYVFIFRVFSRM